MTVLTEIQVVVLSSIPFSTATDYKSWRIPVILSILILALMILTIPAVMSWTVQIRKTVGPLNLPDSVAGVFEMVQDCETWAGLEGLNGRESVKTVNSWKVRFATRKFEDKWRILIAPRVFPHYLVFGVRHSIPLSDLKGWELVIAIGHHVQQINGLTKEESQHALDWFLQLIVENHDLHVRQKWQNENDLAIWNNRSVYHTATFDYIKSKGFLANIKSLRMQDSSRKTLTESLQFKGCHRSSGFRPMLEKLLVANSWVR